MNCKPGDLAIVIRGLKADSPHVGKIVEVLSTHSHNKKLGHIWNIRTSVPVIARATTAAVTDLGLIGFRSELQCPDDWLRPLPEIGDEEKDETLQWLPVPSKDKVPA